MLDRERERERETFKAEVKKLRFPSVAAFLRYSSATKSYLLRHSCDACDKHGKVGWSVKKWFVYFCQSRFNLDLNAIADKCVIRV